MNDKNYVKIRRCSLFYREYFYIDTSEYLADSLFIKHKVRVKFGHEYSKEGSSYRFISCRIRKKEEQAFLNALEELKDKMLLCGHNDYKEFCNEQCI